MNTEQNAEAVSDPIEEPAKVGENEVPEKKKIFFFGQPGCLKHSPLKTNSSENHNNHKKDDESTNTTDEVDQENVSATVNEPSDDEDGDNLLQKISEVLDDEPDSSSPQVAVTSKFALLN